MWKLGAGDQSVVWELRLGGHRKGAALLRPATRDRRSVECRMQSVECGVWSQPRRLLILPHKEDHCGRRNRNTDHSWHRLLKKHACALQGDAANPQPEQAPSLTSYFNRGLSSRACFQSHHRVDHGTSTGGSESRTRVRVCSSMASMRLLASGSSSGSCILRRLSSAW